MMHLSYQHSESFPTRTSGVTLLIAFLVMTMSFGLATGIFTLLFSEYKLGQVRLHPRFIWQMGEAHGIGVKREQINNSANDSYRVLRTTSKRNILWRTDYHLFYDTTHRWRSPEHIHPIYIE